jgi:uncharacterized BrkB/YihY/UPF0761 family membrane protein
MKQNTLIIVITMILGFAIMYSVIPIVGIAATYSLTMGAVIALAVRRSKALEGVASNVWVH